MCAVNCKRLGHTKGECRWRKVNTTDQRSEKKMKGFGPWMMAKSVTIKENRVVDVVFMAFFFKFDKSWLIVYSIIVV